MKFLLLALLAYAACHTGLNWAVLVAGSDGYGNYRHQSDVFHAYQILTKNGIPKDHIIVFAKDDIVNNTKNPFKGKVFNRPNGEDVYAGVVIDYKGNDVTPENYLKVIQGDKEGMQGIGSGRVLESTSEDNIFMFYSDHGSDGLISFPRGYLYADALQKAIVNMHQKGMYNKFVYYLEACYSGSMFQNLPTNLNVYATTAANARESSWAYYCGSEAKVNGTSIGSCLGDEYSVKWMEDSDKHVSPTGYTIGEQFELVKQSTVRSHVMEYGSLDIKGDDIGEFQFKNCGDRCPIRKTEEPIKETQGIRVDSREAYLHYLHQQAMMTNSWEDLEAYYEEIRLTARSRKIFELFTKELNIPAIRESNNIDFRCLRLNIKIYEELCGLNDRDLEFLGAFTTACSLDFVPNPLKVFSTLKAICKNL